jgi:glycosyltransferase involved in cell wall biosynthesis
LTEQNSIRVLHFLNSPHTPGGVEEHARSLVAALPVDRFEITLVCPSTSYDIFKPLAGPRRHVVRLDLHKLSQVGAMRRLISIFLDRGIEVAHSHQFCATMFLAPLAKACGVPWVIETTHVREAWRRGWLKKSYLPDRLVYRMVDRFIAVSKANQRHLLEHKHCHPSRVLLIYNGRDLNHYHSDYLSSLATRALYRIGPSDLLLVHVGRLEPQKGHRVLLAALLQIRRRIPNVKLLLVGEGTLQEQLREESERLGLHESVVFAGFQRDVRNFLQAADLVILPSLWEGMPLVAIEAAAMGKAMVATAVDGTPEVVIDGQTGLLVPPNDVQELAAAVVALGGDDRRRREMGAAARSLIQRQFSLERQVHLTAQLYQEMARPSLLRRDATAMPAVIQMNQRIVH